MAAADLTGGIYGHTQQTLRELFEDVSPQVSHQVALGCFDSLIDVPPRPEPVGA
jgi:hypothetical protein